MTQRRAEIDRLFAEASALPPHARDAFLASAAVDDDLPEVRSLLANADSQGAFIDARIGAVVQRPPIRRSLTFPSPHF